MGGPANSESTKHDLTSIHNVVWYARIFLIPIMSITHTPFEQVEKSEITGKEQRVSRIPRSLPLPAGNEELLYRLCLHTADPQQQPDRKGWEDPEMSPEQQRAILKLMQGLNSGNEAEAQTALAFLWDHLELQRTAVDKAALLQYLTRELVRYVKFQAQSGVVADELSDSSWHGRIMDLLRESLGKVADRSDRERGKIKPEFYRVLEKMRTRQERLNTAATCEFLAPCQTLAEFALQYSILVHADCNADFVYDELLKRKIAHVLAETPATVAAMQALDQCPPEQLHGFMRDLVKGKYPGLTEEMKEKILRAAKEALTELRTRNAL